MRTRSVLCGVALCGGLLCAGAAGGFEAGKAAIEIRVKGEYVPYRVFSVQVLPGETVTVELVGEVDPGGLRLTGDGVSEPLRRDRSARWSAPRKPGLSRLRITDRGGATLIDLNVFVMVPWNPGGGDTLNGYRIGAYPARLFRNLGAYRPPRGFVEVTPDLVDLPISPHFTLGQFLCKQAGGFPKYLLVRERLLLKLEYLLQLVNRKGVAAQTFAVLSGFRTPYYNRSIGNVPNSRHLWGGAADIFVDESPRDGIMDDIDGDGRVTVRDADLLYDLIEEASRAEAWEGFVGGLGRYGATAAHGPFVHVDARGYRARWGR